MTKETAIDTLNKYLKCHDCQTSALECDKCEYNYEVRDVINSIAYVLHEINGHVDTAET